MSRTYTTRPTWVRENDPRERRIALHNHTNGICDLDKVARPPRAGWSGIHFRIGQCRWRLDQDRDAWTDGPTREDVRAEWWGPKRALERDAGRLLAKQYNATADIDDDREPAPDQHRQRGDWYW